MPSVQFFPGFNQELATAKEKILEEALQAEPHPANLIPKNEFAILLAPKAHCNSVLRSI